MSLSSNVSEHTYRSSFLGFLSMQGVLPSLSGFLWVTQISLANGPKHLR